MSRKGDSEMAIVYRLSILALICIIATLATMCSESRVVVHPCMSWERDIHNEQPLPNEVKTPKE